LARCHARACAAGTNYRKLATASNVPISLVRDILEAHAGKVALSPKDEDRSEGDLGGNLVDVWLFA
jgi:hypothetical protein